jgi:hypothetical protein
VNDKIDNQRSDSCAGRLIIYWSVVGIPLAWGIWTTILKLPALFR